MQGICVLEVVGERQRDPHHSGRKKCCGTCRTRRGIFDQMGKKLFFAFSHVRPCFLREALTSPPSKHYERNKPGEDQGKPASVQQLQRVR